MTAERLSEALRKIFGRVLKELADLDNPMRTLLGGEPGEGALLDPTVGAGEPPSNGNKPDGGGGGGPELPELPPPPGQPTFGRCRTAGRRGPGAVTVQVAAHGGRRSRSRAGPIPIRPG